MYELLKLFVIFNAILYTFGSQDTHTNSNSASKPKAPQLNWLSTPVEPEVSSEQSVLESQKSEKWSRSTTKPNLDFELARPHWVPPQPKVSVRKSTSVAPKHDSQSAQPEWSARYSEPGSAKTWESDVTDTKPESDSEPMDHKLDNNSDKNREELKYSVNGKYNCDKNSYFKTITRNYGNSIDLSCNELVIDRIVGTAYGYINGKHIRMDIKGYTVILDSNGNERFRRTGSVTGGECEGDLVFTESLKVPTKGSCDSPKGVTQVQSVKSMFALRGRCESTCFGDDVVDYTPGKTDKHSENYSE